MNMDNAYLDSNHNVIKCSFEEYTNRLKDPNTKDDLRRIIGRNFLPDGTLISTVFLGLDHGWNDKSLWFETMILDSPGDFDYQERYETWAEAIEGHLKALDYARGLK